jgi:hypothetical protein
MHFKLFLSAVLMLLANVLWAGEAARVIFVAGDVKVAGRLVQAGDVVSEGELLATEADGYLYLKTSDNGFFILRPNSKGQIVTYQIDARDPANSRIKLELRSGVARHVSGDAVKNARQNFRFNTPVAAIGVRGTDFTVYANQETAKITVLSGGVVVAPLSGGCLAEGAGPCEGAASRELFANRFGQMLQVGLGQPPVLLMGAEHGPDAISPPRSDEPATNKSGARSASSTNTTVVGKDINLDPLKTNAISQFASQAALAAASTAVGPVQSLTWGRWEAVLDKTVEVDVAALQATNQLIATTSYYAIMRSKEGTWQSPGPVSLGFSLQQSQATILDESSRKVTAARVENGQLQFDFAKSSFFTQFDLVSQGERFQLQNRGEVSSDGKLYGGYQFSRPNNMDVRGALSNDNQTAAYLFQSRLDDRRVASGATFWGK